MQNRILNYSKKSNKQSIIRSTRFTYIKVKPQNNLMTPPIPANVCFQLFLVSLRITTLVTTLYTHKQLNVNYK